jgi:hypothetical protein
VFKVKYDGREMQCDYTEPVLYRYVYNVNRNIIVEAKLIIPPTYNRFTAVIRCPFVLDGHVQGSVIGIIEAVYSPTYGTINHNTHT